MNSYSDFLLPTLAVLPTIFWIIFFYFFSRQKTISRSSLSILFLLGMASVIIALLLERIVFYFLPNDFVGILFGSHPLGSFKDAIIIFFLSFFVIAFIEEIIKFEVFYTITSRTKTCDQIIDYIKLGIAVGLGFATAENVYYFFAYHWDQLFTITTVFILRFSLTTLAHILYGAVLGYYLGHAACNKIREKTFVRKGIMASILLHGFFNFLVFTGTAFYNVILLLIILGVLMKWFHDRRLFEKIITEPSFPSSLIEKPIMAEPVEIESFFCVKVMNSAQKRVMLKDINFCPYCLAKIEPGVGFCPNCEKQIF